MDYFLDPELWLFSYARACAWEVSANGWDDDAALVGLGGCTARACAWDVPANGWDDDADGPGWATSC